MSLKEAFMLIPFDPTPLVSSNGHLMTQGIQQKAHHPLLAEKT